MIHSVVPPTNIYRQQCSLLDHWNHPMFLRWVPLTCCVSVLKSHPNRVVYNYHTDDIYIYIYYTYTYIMIYPSFLQATNHHMFLLRTARTLSVFNSRCFANGPDAWPSTGTWSGRRDSHWYTWRGCCAYRSSGDVSAWRSKACLIHVDYENVLCVCVASNELFQMYIYI